MFRSVVEADCPTRIASDTFSGIGALIPARIFIRVAGTFFRTRLLPYCTLSVCFDRFPLRQGTRYVRPDNSLGILVSEIQRGSDIARTRQLRSKAAQRLL